MNNNFKQNNITEEEMRRSKEILSNIVNYYSQKIVGQVNLERSLLIALMANGHILLESVPGLAKTTAAKVLTEAVNGKFSRIQCTPDLLPSDIVGTQIFNYAKNEFETKIGPIYANFVLLDEINRSNAKTQSATLEAMQEKQITIDGKIYKMPKIFTVIATQNPIEQEGTYLLAEAQLDRFLIKEKVNYPTIDEEVEIMSRIENNVFNEFNAILKLEDLEFLQELTNKVYIDESIKKYIAEIIYATRNPQKYINNNLVEYIDLGSSTRGAIAFLKASKALALINGRTHVIPEDIKWLRYSVLRHRISLNFAALADNITVENIIDAIFEAVPTP
ncbi:aTPase family associated with various cellular activities (AAA) [Clostridium sp. CAG:451]|nr:aTPase family associated with various cellular activities (AAA) [Clostridium sp. CAG:451]